MTEVARLLLEGIDEDAIDFRENYSGDHEGAHRPARRLPEPARQRLAGHRGRHGDVDPAAQRRRTLRRRALPDRQPEGERRTSCSPSCRGRISRPAASSSIRREHRSRRPIAPGAARSACARAGRRRTRAAARGSSSSPRFRIMVPKARLIEKMAELINEKKLPLLADVRDESAEDVRVVLEPRSRTVDPAVLMESLFRLTELESRIPMNMNVLVGRRRAARAGAARGAARMARPSPRSCCCAARATGSARSRSGSKCSRGLLIVYLDLDEVIRIIREEDEPKDELMRVFELTDVQAELHPRHAPALAAPARGDGAQARARRADGRRRREIEELLAPTRAAVEDDHLADPRGEEDLRPPTRRIGKRRTTFADAARRPRTSISTEAMVEREPVTVVVIRQGLDPRAEGPSCRTCRRCSSRATTRCCPRSSPRPRRRSCVLATNGKVFTLEASKLPGGRGFGEPIRLMADMDEGADIVRGAALPGRARSCSCARPTGAASSRRRTR